MLSTACSVPEAADGEEKLPEKLELKNEPLDMGMLTLEVVVELVGHPAPALQPTE
jgi:hypothetical protein